MSAVPEVIDLPRSPVVQGAPEAESERRRAPIAALASVPLAVVLSLAVHFLASKQEPALETRNYTIFLAIILGASTAALAIQPVWASFRRRLTDLSPVLAAALILLGIAEIIT